jgi:putative tricarboxylic transport membrane protein
VGRDGIAGLVVLVGSLVLLALTFRIESNPLVPVSPAFYPRVVLGLTAALSLILLVTDLIVHRRGGAEPRKTGLRYGMVAIMFGIFGAYVLALPYFGFRVATFVFLVAMQYAMDRPRTPRRWIQVLLVALGTTAATYYMFDGYLQVLLPRGRWTGF